MVGLAGFAEQVVNGLSIGMVYVLLAAGLSVIFGVMDVINFAHGELYALGTGEHGGTVWRLTAAA